MQRIAETGVRQGEFGIERDGAAMLGRRRFEILLLVERNAEIAERLGIIGLERDRPAAFGDRLVDVPGEAAHLAQIGMKERHVGGERDRAAQLRDRLFELAGLVGDQAEEMDRVWLARLRLQDLAALRLRLQEPAGDMVLRRYTRGRAAGTRSDRRR